MHAHQAAAHWAKVGGPHAVRGGGCVSAPWGGLASSLERRDLGLVVGGVAPFHG
eukprot:COSAG01_NODE_13389_length_1593_cov_1.113788_3_plen_54_part_00